MVLRVDYDYNIYVSLGRNLTKEKDAPLIVSLIEVVGNPWGERDKRCADGAHPLQGIVPDLKFPTFQSNDGFADAKEFYCRSGGSRSNDSSVADNQKENKENGRFNSLRHGKMLPIGREGS